MREKCLEYIKAVDDALNKSFHAYLQELLAKIQERVQGNEFGFTVVEFHELEKLEWQDGWWGCILVLNNTPMYWDSPDSGEAREKFKKFFNEILGSLGWKWHGSQGEGEVELFGIEPLETNGFMNAFCSRKPKPVKPAFEQASLAGENPPAIPQ